MKYRQFILHAGNPKMRSDRAEATEIFRQLSDRLLTGFYYKSLYVAQLAGFTKLCSQVSQIALAPVFAIFLMIRVARRVATAGANPSPPTSTGANIPAALV
jgi:hypothetical protein